MLKPKQVNCDRLHQYEPNLESKIKGYITDNELSFGKIMGPLRLVIVGELKGPHLFDILEMLGRNECVNRIERALTSLG